MTKDKVGGTLIFYVMHMYVPLSIRSLWKYKERTEIYVLLRRCYRLRCPLARMSGLQCFNMGHNGHGINLYGKLICMRTI